MKIEQIYTGCLAHAAYYVESNGEAAIFDPLREVDSYIKKAESDNAKIKFVFETHFHADFVSGHLDLQKKTGAEIVFGPNAKPDYPALIAKDGQVFKIGDYTIKAMHTPGHTMESTTYLLIDDKGKEHGIITGDTLFIGDVGRPDLAQHVVSDLSQEKLAGYLYDSLRNKIMPLSDDLIVYPNHGAGSACGKKMSKETTDTLGNQKKTNYALRADMTKDEFIDELLNGLTAPPKYFPQNVLLNIGGYESFDNVMKQAGKALTPEEFELKANSDACLILDTRNATAYAEAHVPNSINIGLSGSFAPWVGEMIPSLETPILLVTEEGTEEEAITRLSRVGYDNAQGYLNGGIQSWKEAGKEVARINRISAEELKHEFENGTAIIDVRKKSEFDSEHIEGAINVPLSQINEHLESFPQEQKFIIHCAGGYRSMIAASILQQRGWTDLTDVTGGFKSIKETSIPRTEYVCPSTLL
ncbi:MBL fold metallo-hydrolase [Zunongwangia sp. HGR-M22]|uniref:MBL fold metallo-hydrolase n=1 Tax=Zunongwangia sp. HGR-M22 TaxID=3015168 RepID=UPI0022DDAB41|nr:MBL fold metallo-hydrolase [Zunongwangia sp. HGR-M22]WBL24744.1 MBL fold metallo-hydrolase [Zunongwangia sp. HGR-M22]